jgi:hypothetical protein
MATIHSIEGGVESKSVQCSVCSELYERADVIMISGEYYCYECAAAKLYGRWEDDDTPERSSVFYVTEGEKKVGLRHDLCHIGQTLLDEWDAAAHDAYVGCGRIGDAHSAGMAYYRHIQSCRFCHWEAVDETH